MYVGPPSQIIEGGGFHNLHFQNALPADVKNKIGYMNKLILLIIRFSSFPSYQVITIFEFHIYS